MPITVGRSCGHYAPWIPDNLREFCSHYPHLTFTVSAAVTCCSLSTANGQWIELPGGNHGTLGHHGPFGYREHHIPPITPCNLESLFVSVDGCKGYNTTPRTEEVQRIWNELATRRFPGHQYLGSYTSRWYKKSVDFRMYVLEDAEALRGLMDLIDPPAIWTPNNHHVYTLDTRDKVLNLFACLYHGEQWIPIELMLLVTEQYVAVSTA